MANGYRTDCSGYVSMCLGLKNSKDATLSLTTRSLSPSVLTTISKSALLPGDVMLKKRQPRAALRRAGSTRPRSSSRATKSEARTTAASRRPGRTPTCTRGATTPYRYKKIDDFYPDYQRVDLRPRPTTTRRSRHRACRFPPTSTPTVDALVISSSEHVDGQPGRRRARGRGRWSAADDVRRRRCPSTASADHQAAEAGAGLRHGRAIVGRHRRHREDRLARPRGRSGERGGPLRHGGEAPPSRRSASRAIPSAPSMPPTSWAATSFADGVAVSPIAAKTARPILLTRKTTVPAATLDALKKTGIKRVYVVGGTELDVESPCHERSRSAASPSCARSVRIRYRTALADGRITARASRTPA